MPALHGLSPLLSEPPATDGGVCPSGRIPALSRKDLSLDLTAVIGTRNPNNRCAKENGGQVCVCAGGSSRPPDRNVLCGKTGFQKPALQPATAQ